MTDSRVPGLKWLIAALAVLVLLAGVVELSSVAGARRAAPPAPASLFTDALEPELPIGHEVDQTAPAAASIVTR